MSEHLYSFAKGLPHNSMGEPLYYRRLFVAAQEEDSSFLTVPMGVPYERHRLWVNPKGAFSFPRQWINVPPYRLPLPPAWDSLQMAQEMAELYWMALLRDVPLHTKVWENNPIVAMAVDSLGEEFGVGVTPKTLFRGFSPGDRVGGYVSQFLLKSCPWGGVMVDARTRCLRGGKDYLTSLEEFVAVQNGEKVAQRAEYAPIPRHITTLRDLASYVRLDLVAQAFEQAVHQLVEMGAPLHPDNPYRSPQRYKSEKPFVSWGQPVVSRALGVVAHEALKMAWLNKWLIHMKARPEAIGARVHATIADERAYPIHNSLLISLTSGKLSKHYGKYSKLGGYLLPQAYPEGSPLHPSYPAGHAAIACACTSFLKLWYDPATPMPDPVQASPEGHLVYQEGEEADALTVGGELDKLASNISLGRNAAGIHFVTDYTSCKAAGETIARRVLKECCHPFVE